MKSKTIVITLILFVLSFFLRLSLISKGPYHIDALFLAMQSEKTLQSTVLQPLYGPGYPLTVLLGSFALFFLNLFSIHDPVLAVNLMSVLFSSLCVAALYLFVKRMFDESSALYSAILLSLHPIFLGISVYGKSHVPSLFFLLMALLYLQQFHKIKCKSDLIVAGLFVGLLGAARLQDMVLMLVPLSIFYFWGTDQNVNGKSSKSFIAQIPFYVIFLITAFSLTFLFYIPILAQQDLTYYQSQLDHFIGAGLQNNFSGFASPYLWWSLLDITNSLTIFGVILVTAGFFFLARQHLKIFVFLLSWFLIPFLFYGNLQTTAPRMLMITVFPLLIGLGCFFAKLQERGRITKMISILVLLIVVGIPYIKIYPVLKFRHQHALLPDFSRWVAETTEPNARVITGDEGLFIGYYAKRTFIGNPVNLFEVNTDALETFKQDIDAHLQAGRPVYITSWGLIGQNPDYNFSEFILQHYQMEFVGYRRIEDWHEGCLTKKVMILGLFKLTKR